MKTDLIHHMEVHSAGFSKGQKRIAAFITEHYDEAAFMTACKLGERVDVSESTVVRFATELGFAGYPQLQKAMQELGGAGTVETLVDNETAVQNLGKLAASKGCTSKTEKLGENEYRVTITVGENAKVEEQSGECYTCGKPKTVVVLSSDKMGSGNDELGGALMKAFVFALSQQETLPDTILCYNGGVKLTCEGSESLEDLKGMAARGVEIMSCGTCLNFYDLKEKLAVGEVMNMYVIVEKMSGADRVVRP